MFTTDTNRNQFLPNFDFHDNYIPVIAIGLYDCIMIYVLQPGVILIPNSRLGIQNGSQYCQILYGFQS